MSKCREEYERLFGDSWNNAKESCQTWQAAWNARGKVDAEICKTLADNCISIMDGKAMKLAYSFAQIDIEQEDEK